MIALIRELKKKNLASFIMQNRGLNLIGNDVFVGDATGRMIPGLSLATPHPHNPDAILFEDAFSSTGAWGTKKLIELSAIQKSGAVSVVALGYENVIKNQSQFRKNCKQYGFVPAWASSSQNLHLEIAR